MTHPIIVITDVVVVVAIGVVIILRCDDAEAERDDVDRQADEDPRDDRLEEEPVGPVNVQELFPAIRHPL